MDEDDQYWRRTMERAAHDPTRLSTSTSPPKPSLPRNPPAKIKALIAELGLRYRPTAQTDLQAHAALLALLTQDVADLPPDRLDRAIREWVRTQRFMPRAAELVALCQADQQAEAKSARTTGDPLDEARQWVAQRNARLRSSSNGRRDIEWFVDDAGGTALRSIRNAAPGRE